MNDIAHEYEKIKALDQAWINAESVDETMSFLAEDFIMMAPGMLPVTGSENVRHWYSIFREPLVSLYGETEKVMVAESMDLAFSQGVVHLTLRGDAGEDYREDVKYSIVYKKVDGEWKGVIDFFNASPLP